MTGWLAGNRRREIADEGEIISSVCASVPTSQSDSDEVTKFSEKMKKKQKTKKKEQD